MKLAPRYKLFTLLTLSTRLTLLTPFILFTLHNVYFVKYDVTVSFLAQVLDTVTYSVSHVFVVDTVTYFWGNRGSRV